ncbi:beta-glucosidase [Mammaliicoccus fleurettii]|uniref:beta-glucosidase n=1 Tax=Mammaliicoccus fleurettii TaxID=150056 RepID=UPI002DB66EF2|nr:glycoside hydrolase family 3 C-terminal domain-containing protein [Mammaliicoccus fleurettii]MEB8068586.1 glycoside hydrolase family 3 C-terminal domain-containing protein [Mammaliicoccus fleurettii]
MKNSEIIKNLSLDDKIKIVTGQDFWYTKELENEGLKSLLLTDGPSGVRKQEEDIDALGLNQSIETISFPSLALIACSFDKDLLRQYGEYLGQIAKSEKVNVLLGPGINIKRNPLAGRNFEYMSEDPFVSGKLGTAYIKGLQSQGVGASVKHFATNNRENQRFTNSSNIDERTLREIYLSAFETIVKEAEPVTIMSSYNFLNQVPVSENKWLLTDLLRNEWGYQGVVVSDWSAVKRRAQSLKAGLNLEMPGKGEATLTEVKDAIKNGQLDEHILDVSVDRVLTLMKDYQNKEEVQSYDKETYHDFARELARKSIVLLKNENENLPLKPSSLGLIGELAENPRYQGGGSSKVNPYHVVTPLEAFKNQQYVYAQGYNINNHEVDQQLQQQAVKVAQQNDQVVLFLGYPESYETEGLDKDSLSLPDNQLALIDAVTKENENVTIVLQNGGTVLMPWADKVKSIVETYLPGEAVGEAIYDILTGKQNPAGKLAETVPQRIEDVPSYLTFNQSKADENYREGIYVGYRYYDTKNIKTQFPFGHGLSYTTFDYSNMQITNQESSLKVSLDIKNTGNIFGEEVVQIYIGNRTSDIDMPFKELREFERVALEVNETRTITFEIPHKAMRWYNENRGQWQIDDGEYIIYAGSSVEDIRLEQPITLNITNQTTSNQIHEDTYLSEIVTRKEAFKQSLELYNLDKIIDAVIENPELTSIFENMPLRSLIMVNIDIKTVRDFIDAANEELSKQG